MYWTIRDEAGSILDVSSLGTWNVYIHLLEVYTWMVQVQAETIDPALETTHIEAA